MAPPRVTAALRSERESCKPLAGARAYGERGDATGCDKGAAMTRRMLRLTLGAVAALTARVAELL